ncbi:MAG TPA: hypothetical protein VKT71_08660 [Candidatus Acidoferrales bacterium]|nr:hypothetical protein [Candidatus Acidoferrales bacterium]
MRKRIARQFIFLLFAALVFSTLFVAAGRATTLARLSLEQLAAGSAAVARVRCTGVSSRWENGSIWTLVEMNVLETMKGNLPQNITVRLPGGRVGHLTAAVDGTPRFAPGTQAILFLQPSRAGGFTIAGWVEGTFRISRDPRTGGETVTQDSSAFATFDAAARAFRTEGIRRMPVNVFRARVAAAVARNDGRTR